MEEQESPRDLGELLVAENVAEAIWLRLRRLTSSVLCKRMLMVRGSTLPVEVITKKAEQTAWAVQSALGYWEGGAIALNAKVLTRYYALLQISIAEQVASPNAVAGLHEIQRHTEGGHGLSTLTDPDGEFPGNYNICCLKSGHFFTYCRHKGIDLNPYAFEKRPRKWAAIPNEQRGRFFRSRIYFAGFRNYNRSWTNTSESRRFLFTLLMLTGT